MLALGSGDQEGPESLGPKVAGQASPRDEGFGAGPGLEGACTARRVEPVEVAPGLVESAKVGDDGVGDLDSILAPDAGGEPEVGRDGHALTIPRQARRRGAGRAGDASPATLRDDLGMRWAALSTVACVLASLLGACGEDAPPPRRAPPRVLDAAASADRIGPYPRSEFFLAHDRFLPADDPRTVPAGEAGFLREDDEVFGVVVGDRARAYPIPMLAWHHVVNDVIGSTPVGVTY
jgi:hypothetical protein